jgi:hypothetical protein
MILKTMPIQMPIQWFIGRQTWDCDVFENQVSLANIGFSIWGEAGQIKIQSANDLFKVYRESPDSNGFLLTDGQTCIAQAKKPNPLFRQFFIEYGDRRYELQATSAAGRQFIVQEYGQVVGSIAPAHRLTRRAVVDLPDRIALPVRLFMVWLVLTLWRRGQENLS